MRKLNQSITKSSKTKLNIVYTETGSSGNVGKFQFLTGENILPEKDLSEEAATIKRFEYLPSGNELKSKQELKFTRFMDVIKE